MRNMVIMENMADIQGITQFQNTFHNRHVDKCRIPTDCTSGRWGMVWHMFQLFLELFKVITVL